MTRQFRRGFRRSLPLYMKISLGEIPELIGARCNSPTGRQVMDALLGQVGETGPPRASLLEAGRFLCGGCPARPECAAWAVKEEDPPGSWGGMYGGYTAYERRTIRYGTRMARDGEATA